MMIYKYKPIALLLLLALLILKPLQGQTTFTLDQLLWYVEKYHPVSRQAQIILNQRDQGIKKARGKFDPKLFAEYDKKQFDSKTYFNILGSGLKIPTWYGIELKTGFDQNKGLFLNPENSVPQGGLWHSGISVPLGQGLFIDKRRAALKQAQIAFEGANFERAIILNNLFYDAIKDYWKWVQLWNQFKVYEEGYQLALDRFKAVKKSYEFGDKPAIDTLEAFIQVQNRLLGKNMFELEYQNMTLELSNYLWFENNTPLVISDSLQPPVLETLDLSFGIPNDSIGLFINSIDSIHPEVLLYQNKLDILDVERKLKIEALKPSLNINYNFLNEPVGNEFISNFSTENYKWGIQFQIPVLLREERASLQMVKLKTLDTELTMNQKILNIGNKIRKHSNSQLNLRNQVALFRDNVTNYDALLNGEKQKFDTGESSLFLVNSRETKLIAARIKLIELSAKYEVATAGVLWASGRLFS